MSDARPGRRAWRWHPALVACGKGCLLSVRALRLGLIEFYRSSNLTFASSIAYYALLSIFPFILLVLSVLARIAVNEGTDGPTLLDLLSNALPSRFDFLAQQFGELARAPLNLSVAGTIITLWASMGVFGAITSAINHAWGVETNYSFLKHKLVAFIMLLAAGALAIIAMTVASAAHVVESTWFADVLARYPNLAWLSGVIVSNAVTPAFILVVGLIYYFVPNTDVRLRDVWFGAIVAGLLWRLAFSGFAFYVRDLSRFTVHGSVAAVVVFLVWIYLSAVILLYGVEVTAAWARLRLETRRRQLAELEGLNSPADR
ncbi:MAG: YihY/virulence factor BrkB family protein [Acidobacteria bacterium]|nr:YihY/virulence factor BrkB family protein [Acidobacteriota bacterium]